MKKALINIDYTYDFIAADGKLTCGLPGQAIHDEIYRLTREFYEAGEFIAFTIDSHQEHDPYHPETQLFPPHNIEGTSGCNLYGELEHYYRLIRQSSNVYYTTKTRYSAFAGTSLEIKLRERGIEELHLVGVCTDICVLHTAIDAYNKGFRIVIHSKAVASFNQAGHEWAMQHFAHTLGATIV